MKYLITGGAGFIGSHLTASLLKDGHQVTIVDNFSTGSRENLRAVAGSPALQVIEGDVVTMPELLDREIAACDTVVHLAAAVGVNLVVKDPIQTITTNVHGTENVLRPAALYGKRTVIASTSEVYGKSQKKLFSESDDLLIGTPAHCRWAYACSKLLDEFYLMAYCTQNNLPGTVVRFFNTVGPRQTGRYGMVVPRFVAAALAGAPIPVYGSGKQSRCFCHVSDVVRALRLLLENKSSYGKVFNIGTQRSITIEELAALVIERTGSKSVLEYIPYEKAYEAGFEDMMRRAPDTKAIFELTNWQPELSLEKIIDDVAAAMRQ